jgi:DNA helicase-2/ATP-dependent DNA helicase PcrA
MFDKMAEKPGLNEYQIENIRKCKRNFSQLAQKVPTVGIDYLLDVMGYREFLMDRASESDASYDTYLEVVRVLRTLSFNCVHTDDVKRAIHELEEAMKAGAKAKGKGVVTLSTIHSSKGLEWNQVFLADLLEGSFPNRDVMKQFQTGNTMLYEEERRLFYVAMTRAKDKLCLLKIKDVSSSPFVKEVEELISPELKQKRLATEKAIEDAQKISKQEKRVARGLTSSLFSGLGNSNTPTSKGIKPIEVGREVKHLNFGSGRVISCDTKKITIRFLDGDKQLSLPHCIEQKLIQISE